MPVSGKKIVTLDDAVTQLKSKQAPAPIKKPTTLDAAATDLLKKKDGTTNSGGFSYGLKKISPIPPSKSTSGSETQKSTPSITPSKENSNDFSFDANEGLPKQQSKITTPDGAELDITNFNLPVDKNAYLVNLNEKIKDNKLTPGDLNDISSITGKSPKVIQGYFLGGAKVGASLDYIEDVNKQKENLIASINGYNKQYGTDFDASKVLSSAETTSQFLNVLRKRNVKDISTLGQETNKLDKGEFVSSNNITDVSLFGLTALEKYEDLLKNHLSDQIVKEAPEKGETKDQTLTRIAKLTNPDDFLNVQKSLNIDGSIGGKDIVGGITLSGLSKLGGKIYDKIFGSKEKDEILNSQKGSADIAYNDAKRREAYEDISTGVTTGNKELEDKGNATLKTVDDDVIYKYPSLVKQQIAKQVSDYIANKSGQTNASDDVLEGFQDVKFGRDEGAIKRAMQDLGYLDNPKTKDIAQSMLSQPELFSDASYLGGIKSSFLEPFKNLGLSIGDITGFRNDKDITADRIKDQMFPKETEDLKGNVSVTRNIVNTTANLAGMAVIAGATEGVGEGLGLGRTAAQRLGAAASFGIPSFDENIKYSQTFTKNPAVQNLYATMGAVLNTAGGEFLDLGKLSRVPGLSEDFQKIATGVVEKEMTEDAAKSALAKAKDKVVNYLVKYGTNVTKGSATFAYFDASNNILKVAFGDPKVKAGDIVPKAAHAFMNGVTGMAIMGAFGAAADIRDDKNSTYKGFIYNMALNHDAAADVFKIALDNGELNQNEYNQKISILNTAKVAKSALDVAQVERGIKLEEPEKAAYVANKTAENFLRDRATKTTDEGLAKKYVDQANKLGEQTKDIMNGLKFSSTVEPLYDLYDAGNKFKEEQEKFNSGESTDDTKLLESKDKYQELYKKYITDKELPSNQKPAEDENTIQNNKSEGTKEPIVTGNKLEGKKIFTDFNNTIADKDNKLLPFGEEVKQRINNGEDVTIVTRSKDKEGEQQGTNKKRMLDALGLESQPGNLKIVEGLEPGEKTDLVKKEGGVLIDNSGTVLDKSKEAGIDHLDANELNDTVPVKNREVFSTEPEIKGGRTIVTHSGLTEKERQEKISQREKETQLTDRGKGEQSILEKIDKYNDLPNGRLGKTKPEGLNTLNAIRNEIASFNEKHDAKYKFDDRSGRLKNDNNRAVGRSFLEGGDKAIDDKGVVLRDRDQKTQETFDLLSEHNAFPNGYRLDGNRMSDAELDATIQDIQDGIPSKRANNYLDNLEKQMKDDDFDLGDQRMLGTKTEALTLNDLIGATKETSGEPLTAEALDKWLNDEGELTPEMEQTIFDNIDNLIQDHDTETSNQGPGKKSVSETKGNVGEENKQASSDETSKEKVADKKPPAAPPDQLDLEGKSPGQQWTAIRKSKQNEIQAVKQAYEKQGIKTWSDTLGNALDKLQTTHPEKNLYDAALSEMSLLRSGINNPSFTPDESLAAMQYLKREIETKRSALYDNAMSDDELLRTSAIVQDKVLFDQLGNTGLTIKDITSTAGRTLNYAQSELGYDEDHGLQLRRMDLAASKEDKLSDEDLQWTSDMWEKEKDLMKREHELKVNGMQESFDKQIDQLKNDYEDKLKKAAKGGTKKEKTLSQKGQEAADKILKFKIKTDPNILQSNILGLPIAAYNALIDGVAAIVKTGADIGQAIDEMLTKDDYKHLKKDDVVDHFTGGMDRQEIRENSISKIKETALLNKVNGITSEMVGKNLIRDYVNSHIGDVDPKDILQVATDGLKETLPDITKEKLTEAYLKEGEFKQPTSKKLESDRSIAKKKLLKLASVEKDLNDLKEKKNLFKAETPDSKIRAVDKDIEEKEKELKLAMKDAGQKVSNEDKYTKASYNTRAEAHNTRLDGIIKKARNKAEDGSISEDAKNRLSKLSDVLESAKVKLDENSAFSHKSVLDHGLDITKKIKSEFDRNLKPSDIGSLGEFKKDLQRSIDKFGSDKDESEQNIKLQRTKDQYARDIDEYGRKINANEYEDKEPIILKKSDAELVKLERERTSIKQQYEKKKEEYDRQNKSGFKRAADFIRASYVGWLIGSPVTVAKVAWSAFLRPNVEAGTKLTTGKLFDLIAPSYSEKAKEGGESSSVQSVKKLYEAYFAHYTPEQLQKKVDEANYKFEKSSKEYHEFNGELSGMDQRTSDYKDGLKKLNKLDNQRKKDLVAAVGNSIYQYIGGSSTKDFMQVLLHRASTIESMFGQFDTEKWEKFKEDKNKFDTAIDNINYTIGFVGRSHAALKTLSGRASFAAGFMARLEGAVNDGIDISQPDKILEIANESYMDWDRGKYQQANKISDGWNKIVSAVDEVSPAAAYIMRTDVAVTRVPVNMLREAIMDFTLGSITSSADIAKTYYKASKGIDLKIALTPEGKQQFRDQLKEELDKISPDEAAATARAFRKGGFGLGMYALGLFGLVKFGGFAHKGQKEDDKKTAKRNAAYGTNDLSTGQITVGGKKIDDTVSKVLEHSPQLYPLFLGLGLKTVYDNNKKEGESTSAAAGNDALQHMNIILNSIPQISKLVLPMATDVYKSVVPKIGEWDDIDQEGNPIKRKAFEMRDYLNILPGWGDKKDVLSDAYYKQAVKVKQYYQESISSIQNDANLSDEEKSKQINDLSTQEDSDINDIYKMNKENPQ